MGTNAFVNSVWRLINRNPPNLNEPIILEAPPGTNLRELVAEFGRWAGQHRNLAAGGFVDPSLSERTGLPLVEPFGAGELLEMRGWGYRNRWVGCGMVASPDGPRAVVVISHREDPVAAGFPQGASWAEKLRIVTGWEPIPKPRVDWPAIEADLGPGGCLRRHPRLARLRRRRLHHPVLPVDRGPGHRRRRAHRAAVRPRGGRLGPHRRRTRRLQAPANQNLRGASKIETLLTDDQHGELNAKGVNCLRDFQDRGLLMWGARTRATTRDLNVRRLVSCLSDSIRQS